MEPLSTEQAYQQMRALLNEKQGRYYLAAEAQRRGSPSTVAREAGVSLHTVKRGLREREAGETYEPGARIRRPGAGRKKLARTDPTLLTDLEQLLEPKGDPMSLVRWTTKSLAHLVQALEAQGHQIKTSALAELLHAQGFSARCQQEDDRGGCPSRPRGPVYSPQGHVSGLRSTRRPDHFGGLHAEGTARSVQAERTGMASQRRANVGERV